MAFVSQESLDRFAAAIEKLRITMNEGFTKFVMRVEANDMTVAALPSTLTSGPQQL